MLCQVMSAIDSIIQVNISKFPFSLKNKPLQMRDSNIKFFIYKAKCLHLIFDYYIVKIVFIIQLSIYLKLTERLVLYKNYINRESAFWINIWNKESLWSYFKIVYLTPIPHIWLHLPMAAFSYCEYTSRIFTYIIICLTCVLLFSHSFPHLFSYLHGLVTNRSLL